MPFPSYIRVRAVVWECSEKQTHTRTAVANIHFASATLHTKCNSGVHIKCLSYRNQKCEVHFSSSAVIRLVNQAPPT